MSDNPLSLSMHHSYEERLGHPPDFRVSYRFYSAEEGGRRHLPFQGIRSDLWYEAGDNIANDLFMIWPEFEDENGSLILENDQPVPAKGSARMWIINAARRTYHRERIKPGMTVYFMEGSKRTAICEVIEICGLSTNPI